MTDTELAETGQIFISYRHSDSEFQANWLYRHVCRRFGQERVFKDVDSIAPGDNWVESLQDAVGSCDVLLALIGPGWLDAKDSKGGRRLDNPEDVVRVEIEAAIERKVRLIPVLIGETAMPGQDELPASLAPLTHRQAQRLSAHKFEEDADPMLAQIERTLDEEAQKRSFGGRQSNVVIADKAWYRRFPNLKSKPWIISISAAALVVLALIVILLLARDWEGGEEKRTTDPPAPAPTLSPDEQNLVDQLPVSLIDVSTCVPQNSDQYTSASVSCNPGPRVASSEGAPDTIAAFQERSPDLLQQDMDKQFGTDLTETDCGKPPAYGNWTLGDQPMGDYYCALWDDPAVSVYAWTYSDESIVVMAQSSTVDTATLEGIEDWWRTLELELR